MEFNIIDFSKLKELEDLRFSPLNIAKDKLAKDIAESYDDFLFSQFKIIGYSREEVLKLSAEGRLIASRVGCGSDEYYLDGKLLFGIDKKLTWDENTNDCTYSCTVEYECKLAPGTNPIME